MIAPIIPYADIGSSTFCDIFPPVRFRMFVSPLSNVTGESVALSACATAAALRTVIVRFVAALGYVLFAGCLHVAFRRLARLTMM